MRISAAARIGMAMIVLGAILYGGFKWWIETRNFTPVDTPVSLHQGDILRQDFSTNTSGRYWAYILTDEHSWNQEDSDESIQAHFRWEIRDRTGKEIENYSWSAQADGSVTGTELGFLDLGPGKYSVELIVLRDLARHAKYHPRLVISTDDSDARFTYLVVRWISVFVILGGVALLAMQLARATSEGIAEEKSFTAPPTGSYQSDTIRKRIRESTKQVTPHWSVYAAITFFSVLTPIWVLTVDRLPIYGYFVTVPALGAKAASIYTPRIIVRVIADKDESKYLVNGNAVQVNQLREALQHEVARQGRWIVYIDGDSQCLHADVMVAVDAALSAHAKPILITPSTRALIEGVRKPD